MLSFLNTNKILSRDYKAQYNIIKHISLKKICLIKMWLTFINLSASSFSALLQSYSFFEEICLVKPTILQIKVKKNKKNRQKEFLVGFTLTNGFQISNTLRYLIFVALFVDKQYTPLTYKLQNELLRLTFFSVNSFIGLKTWYYAIANMPIQLDLIFSKKKSSAIMAKLFINSYEKMLY